MGIFSEIDAATNLGEKGFGLFRFLKKKSKSCDDYYYEEYNKKIYVKKNGNGLIVSSCILKVIDPLKADYLIRTVDISDAKRDAEFESFDSMKNTSLNDIFTKFGFWYISSDNIVTDVEEFYEDRDAQKKDDKKYISIKFILDVSKLEAGKTYKITYAFSIPGLFPILDGRFDLTQQDRSNYKDFRSYISALHTGHHLRFSAYFEDGIEFKEKPSGNTSLFSFSEESKKNSSKTRICVFKDNIFYKKYYFEVENPQEYKDIYMKWNVKNPK